MKTMTLLLVIISTTILTSCRPNLEDEEFTITMLFNETEEFPYQEDWPILDAYHDKWNVLFDMQLGNDASYEDDIDLHMKAESPPDVILKVWPETVEEYINDGEILAISDYIDKMPYFKQYIEDNHLEQELDKLRYENGNFYILPGYQRDLQVQQWIYRKDLFDLHSLETPTTYEELFVALSTLKSLYPSSTPITATWGGAHLFSMMGANYGIPAGWSGTTFYNETVDQFEYAPATDQYKAMYQYLNRLYEAEILDPAIFTQSNEEFITKLTNGSAFVTTTWISSGFDNWNQALEDNGISGGTWVPLPVMESTNGIAKLPPVNRFRKGIAITSGAVNKPYFDQMIAFLDWAIYSEEGIDLTYWGLEDVTYEVVDGNKQLLSNIVSNKNPAGITSLREYGFASIFDLCENEAFEDYKKPDEIVTFLSQSYANNDALPMTPELPLTSNAIDMITIVNDNLAPYVTTTAKQFITGELDIDTEWDDYLAELDRLGYHTMETIWNNAWSLDD